MKQINIPIKKLISSAIIPKYATEGSAGFDFHAIVRSDGYAITIYPNETELIKTGLAMEIPLGYELQIRPRSGLSLKTKLRIANSPATIDSDYRGEIGIIVENIGSEPIAINHHDRIAQGILKEVPQANFIEVNNLNGSERGSGGFGHSGKS